MTRAVTILTREEEQELAFRWRDHRDERALHRIIVSHQPLVEKAARRLRHLVPMEDLIQEGRVGLLIAAQRFEPQRGLRFATFAQFWIRAQMAAATFREQTVKGSQSVKAKQAFLRGERTTQTISLDAPIRGGGDEDGEITVGSTLVCPEPRPDELIDLLDSAQDAQRLKVALDGLSPRERDIIEARWLVDEPSTLEVIGTILGISKERVRQIEAAAIGKIRSAMLKPKSNRSRAASSRYKPRAEFVARKLAEAAC